MTTWFTADTHFGHKNIINFCGRPFETKEEHDETLIDNWNKCVQKNDVVYHIGDFGFGPPEMLMRKYAGRLRGKIHLVLGNHDKEVKREPICRRFEFIKDAHLLTTQCKKEKVRIYLHHYACRTWPFSNHGSFHLFGHSHNNLAPWGRSFDVGVDSAVKMFGSYRPVSLDEVYSTCINLTLEKDYKELKPF